MNEKSNRRDFLKVAGTSLAVTGYTTFADSAVYAQEVSGKSQSNANKGSRHTGTLKAGAATRIVNPTKPALPIGHGATQVVSHTKIYSDICTQALVLEDEYNKRIVIISCDFMQMPPETADLIKEHIFDKYGIDSVSVCAHAIHNHASPPIIKREVEKEEHFDQEYADFFISQTVAVVGDAISKLEPANLRYCEDVCSSVAINRRPVESDGKVHRNAPNNKGLVDFKVRVVAIDSVARKKPIVILAEYASHPVVTATIYLGGEYPSFFRKHVEDKFPGVTAMFLQGCAGNIRIQILNEKRTDWVKGAPKDADRFGFDLADAAERAVTKQQWDEVVGPIETEFAMIDAPLKEESSSKTLPFRIQAFRIGAKSKKPFILLALGAEVFIEYGLELESRLQPANTIVIGYANAMAGYLPTTQAIYQGGYEPNSWREWWYALPGPYAPEVESVILNASEKLARPKSL